MQEDLGDAANQSKSLVQISDLLGLRQPATELIRAITRGVGDVFEPWLHLRKVKADIEGFALWKRELSGGLNEMPHSFELTLGDRTSIRLEHQERIRQRNRELISVEAIADSVAQTNLHSVESSIEVEDDWIDRFWRISQDISDEKMQTIWGRILARQTLGVGKYSIRTLEAISTLSHAEARKLERLAEFAVFHRSMHNSAYKCGILKSLYSKQGDPAWELKECNRRLSAMVGDDDSEIFGSMGVYIESGWSFPFLFVPKDGVVDIRIGKQILQISGFNQSHYEDGEGEKYVSLGHGTQVSPIGMEIISLIEVQINENFLNVIKQGLNVMNLDLKIL